MAYRSRKMSVPLPAIIAIIAVLIIAGALIIGFVFGRGGQGDTSSDPASDTESTLPEPDNRGDIIFYPGVGYDLLSVVNKNYNMSATDGIPELVILSDEVTNREGGDYQVDARVVQPLTDMLEAARSAGHNAILWSSYRTQEYQNRLYERALTDYMDEHPGADRAEAVANVTDVAPPGTSEHCTGLSVDIYTWTAHAQYDLHLDQRFGNDPLGGWLKENAHLYGFILRYPEGKDDITMISYEPWHFRYVGLETAAEIYERGITLEEYTGKLGE